MPNTNIAKKVNTKPIMIALLMGGFSTLLCETLLNIALPIFMSNFAISAAIAQWLITGFILVLGIFIPCTGFLIHTFSTRKLFFTAMSLFICGSLIAGFALNFPMILFGRLIQALGCSILIPLNMTTILAIYPPEKLGAANGMFILVIMLAPVIGPTVSGIVLHFFNWHYLFFVTLPFNIASMILAYFYLQNVTKLTKPKLDILSIFFSALGFGGTIFAISRAGEYGLRDLSVSLSLVIGLLALSSFVYRQFQLERPMLELRIFRYPLFSLGVVFIMLTMMSLFANLIIMPIFLQRVLLMSSFWAGLLLLPGGIITCLMAPIAGRLYDKYGPKVLVPLGYGILITMFGFLSHISATTQYWQIIFFVCCLNLGIPLITITVQTHTIKFLPIKHRVHGSVILNTSQQIAAATGSSLFISLMLTGKNQYLANHQIRNPLSVEISSLTAGINHAFSIAIFLLLIGFFLSFLIQPLTRYSKQHQEKSYKV